MNQRILFSLLFSVTVAAGQNAHITRLDGKQLSLAEVDGTIRQLTGAAHVTGLGLAILTNDTIVYAKAFGYKRVDTKAVLDTSTVFRGASLSKAVFAYICLKLVQQGVLDLDKPLGQYLAKPLPDYPKYSDLAGDERWKLITARMCLSHTTGFPNWRFLNARTADYDPKGKLAIYFTPGSRYAYSGEGFALLQMIVETITGKDLEDLAIANVFQPIGMSRTSYVWQHRFEADCAVGYDEAGRPVDQQPITASNAAASLHTTLADFARFVQYIMQQRGLSRQLFRMMVTPQIRIHSKTQFPTVTDDTTAENRSIDLSYGLGWGLLRCAYGRAFFKEGHDDGWSHYNINFIEKGTSIIIMTNSSNGESIFREALSRVIGDTYTPWKWERYTPYHH